MSGYLPEVLGARVEEAVKLLLETLADTIASGERIDIRGFGRVSLKNHPHRQGRNLKTGETVEIRAKRVAHFKPGKDMRVRVGYFSAKIQHPLK